MTSNVNNRCQSQKRCSFDLFFVENERESRSYPMNSHQFSLVLLNIIAASSCFGLETIEFSRVLFLSCMSNQASSVRSIYLPPLKHRNFSIFMIEVCKKRISHIGQNIGFLYLVCKYDNLLLSRFADPQWQCDSILL